MALLVKKNGTLQTDNNLSEGFNADTKFFVRAGTWAKEICPQPISAKKEIGPRWSADQDESIFQGKDLNEFHGIYEMTGYYETFKVKICLIVTLIHS